MSDKYVLFDGEIIKMTEDRFISLLEIVMKDPAENEEHLCIHDFGEVVMSDVIDLETWSDEDVVAYLEAFQQSLN